MTKLSMMGSGRSGQSIGILILPTLRVPAALPLLADEAGVYTIPLANQTRPLAVLIESAWPGYEQDYFDGAILHFDLIWGSAVSSGAEIGVVVGSWEVPMTADPADLFPLDAAIPEPYLRTQGIFYVSYRVWITEVLNPETSQPAAVFLDKTAPNNGQAGNPPALNENTRTIDQAYLVRNNDRVIVRVELWPDVRLEDVIEVFLEPSKGPLFDPLARLQIQQSHKDQGFVELTIRGDDVRRKANGSRVLYYWLMDRASNRGAISLSLSLTVNVAQPMVLPAPQVPLAEDGLVDLEDARRGVQVHIPRIVDARTGDTLQAYWNGRTLAPYTVPSTATWPVRLPVAWEILAADGFSGRTACKVYYTLTREITSTSSTVAFEVDLSVAGPDPEGPDPIHRLLKPVVVKGRTGDNILTRQDMNLPVTVEVTLYAVPEPGEILELYWGNNADVVATYTVKAGDTAGSVVRFSPVPYAAVLAAGDGPAIAVFYWTFNGVNRHRARDTHVRVAVQPIVGFKPVKFPDVTLWGWINCQKKPWNGIRISVPGNPGLWGVGDNVEVSWQLFRTLEGASSTPPTGSLTDVVYFDPIKLSTPAQVNNGFMFTMTRFADLVLQPLKRANEADGKDVEGVAVVNYRVARADGQGGESDREMTFISLQLPNGSVCDGSNV